MVDFSADPQFVLVEKKLVQEVLHLCQSKVKATVGEQMFTGLSCDSGLNGAVYHLSEGAQPSLQAGDVSLDLTEEVSGRALQLIVQKFKVMDDTS